MQAARICPKIDKSNVTDMLFKKIIDQYETAEDIRACLACAKQVIQAERVYAVMR